jgi:hypothetical protein
MRSYLILSDFIAPTIFYEAYDAGGVCILSPIVAMSPRLRPRRLVLVQIKTEACAQDRNFALLILVRAHGNENIRRNNLLRP